MTELSWSAGPLTVVLARPDDGPVALVDLRTGADRLGSNPARARQPLVEVGSPRYGQGTGMTGAHTGTVLGAALRYVEHEERRTPAGSELLIEQADPASGLRVHTTLLVPDGAAAVTVHSTLTLAAGSPALPLWWVSSIATGAVVADDPARVDIRGARSSWSAENRWWVEPLPGAAIPAGTPAPDVRNTIRRTSLGTWSSGTHNPVGIATHRDSGVSLAWQVEHNGGWLWEAGGTLQAGGPGAYVTVCGPTDLAHHWAYDLTPETSFTTVPATIAVGASPEDALGELARSRRARRRPHRQNTTLPVIFNDYMNTLNGDPTEDRLTPLIDAAAAVGCEYFCIDAGWYDDTSGWWASVGDWRPSTTRFPHGLAAVLDRIRGHGMVPGLWLEPAVIGVTSEAAATLPDEAFLQRGGVRIRERDRYFLDLRHPAARDHLDGALDRIVAELGIGYVKFDDNVTPGPGTDLGGPSVGHNLLEHNRALLSWLEGLLDRHPDLVIENCASGAMRSDFAMLSRLALQSTSDQTDPLRYPAIAVGALGHVLPEQAGHWAYPQAAMTDEQIAFTLCTGLAGRLYQSGFLDRLSHAQRCLVAEAIGVHRQTRQILARSIPRFPTGLPDGEQAWVGVAFDAGDETLLLAWRQAGAPDSVELALPHLIGRDLRVEPVYPDQARLPAWAVERTDTGVRVSAASPEAAARMWRVTPI